MEIKIRIKEFPPLRAALMKDMSSLNSRNLRNSNKNKNNSNRRAKWIEICLMNLRNRWRILVLIKRMLFKNNNKLI